MRSLILLLVFTFATGCTDAEPPPGPPCGGEARREYCKEACGADSLCPGGDQPACEVSCRACAVDDNYCPSSAPR